MEPNPSDWDQRKKTNGGWGRMERRGGRYFTMVVAFASGLFPLWVMSLSCLSICFRSIIYFGSFTRGYGVPVSSYKTL